MRRFEDATVVVSGAARGIGEGIAVRFAQEGANVVITDLLDEVENTAKRIADEYKVKTKAVKLDVTDEEQVVAFYKQVEQDFKHLDVSVQNAGIITIEHLEKMSLKDFNKVVQVDAVAEWLCCREAARIMVKQDKGRLINSSSGQGRKGFIYTPHYACAKMGVIGITQSLAIELAPHHITVNAFCPGIIVTEMWEYNDRVWGQMLSTDKKQYKKGELMQEWVDAIPLRYAGKPSDIAGVIAFLASDDAAYITGQTINIDGGMFMN
ncbi:MAG: SDR family oxidoreductase [Succinivibrio sp.]|nr:SDR family oxidoreductase [Succinivibrio sp.]